MTTFEGQPAKIFPVIVEDTIGLSMAVNECSEVGRKRKNSDYYEVVAFIVKEDPSYDDKLLREELITICRETVPSYMNPVEYHFLSELPRTSIGKIDFCALEKEAQNE